VNDNFFDLGGDSLLLTALHRRLQSELGRDFPMTDLFQYPTIRSLAAQLGRQEPSKNGAHETEARAQRQRAAMQRARPASQPLSS
jgi:hypothetical protein